MSKTNIWDFACRHPFIFMLGLTSVAATVGNVIISALNRDNIEEKENNNGVQTDNV